ncbi:MAG: class I SAM-dependent methyltransferase [Candidatus Thorarchaeota archaeon]|nr:class I SAM-dependent methyltransferase [Candidatus Thorarchaeota archaeon]
MMPLRNKPTTWGYYWDVLGNRLVDMLEIRKGSHVLDVGTGGGSTLFPALEKVGKTGQVTGIDKREKSVENITAELKRCGISNASVQVMSAEEMSFNDASFDYIVSGFIGWGRRYDFEKNEYKYQDLVMSEILRVLRAGGKVGISTWLFQEDSEWIMKLVQPYLPSAPVGYSKETRAGWDVIMSNAEFSSCDIITFDLDYVYPSVHDWWHQMMNYGWQYTIESIPIDERPGLDELYQTALDTLGKHLTEEKGVTFRKSVLFALGVK